MSYDNRIFNINGEGDDKTLFCAAMALAFHQESVRKICGFKVDRKKGLILYQYDFDEKHGIKKLEKGEDLNAVVEFAWKWLESNPKIEMTDWDRNCDHDGHNEIGWRIYCEDWGHVESSGFLAIKPAFCWYGK